MTRLIDDFKDFLDSSPTSWHAAENIAIRLASKEFIPLEEAESWKLEKGKSYFIKKGGMVIAFSLPLKTFEKMMLTASHTDSPALKLKPQAALKKENMQFLSAEVYGAPLLNSWLNRDLGIAGRVVVKDGKGQLHEKLLFIDDAPLVIPQLAIHLDRDVNEKGLVLSKQHHLYALGAIDTSDSKEGLLQALLKRHFPYYEVLFHDLMLVPLEEAKFIGMHSEMLSSYRLDNLTGVHAALAALAAASRPYDHIAQIALFYDHEEIGSRTAEGALSPLFRETLERIAGIYQMDREKISMVKAKSLCLSVDMAHAYHPSFSDRFDIEHKVLPSKGVVIKVNADKKYATDALGGSYVAYLCQKQKIPYQFFTAHSDIACGSTVGPFITQNLGITTVDIGAPQFSMHSARELIACKDYLDLYQLLFHFYQDLSPGSLYG